MNMVIDSFLSRLWVLPLCGTPSWFGCFCTGSSPPSPGVLEGYKDDGRTLWVCEMAMIYNFAQLAHFCVRGCRCDVDDDGRIRLKRSVPSRQVLTSIIKNSCLLLPSWILICSTFLRDWWLQHKSVLISTNLSAWPAAIASPSLFAV